MGAGDSVEEGEIAGQAGNDGKDERRAILWRKERLPVKPARTERTERMGAGDSVEEGEIAGQAGNDGKNGRRAILWRNGSWLQHFQ